MNLYIFTRRQICLILATLSLTLVTLLAGCVDDGEVRDTCATHGGVQSANGNNSRVFVTCKDGYYRKVH